METALYDTLGLEKDATTQDIKQAYKKLAMKHHPDRGGDEDTFKQLSRAYDVLTDNQKREVYDQLGETGLENIDQENSQPNPFDMFNELFQQQNTNKLYVVHPLKVSLKDLYLESKIQIKYSRACPCTECKGLGYVDDTMNRIDKYVCTECEGQGSKLIVRQMGPMIQQMQVPCNNCKGKGHNIPEDQICKECKGDKSIEERLEYEVELKNTMHSKTQIRVKNKGHIDNEGNTGDLIIIIQEEMHPMFRRSGTDLVYRKIIPLADALCGIKFIIDFVNDQPLLIRSRLVINPLKTYKLIGWGMDKKSNLLIEFDVKFPDKSEIKPEFKKHIKKYLKYTDEEIDTAGLKSSTLIEADDQEEQIDNDTQQIPLMGGQQCQQQ